MRKQVDRHRQVLTALDQLMDKKGGFMEYEVKVREEAPQPIVSIRTRTSIAGIGDDLGRAFGELFKFLGRSFRRPAGPPFCLYHDAEFKEEDIDMEVCVPTKKLLWDREKIKAGEMPAGQVAFALHVGPYENISRAYQALAGWIQEHGHDIAGPARETYLVGPAQVKDPAAYQTEVAWPIGEKTLGPPCGKEQLMEKLDFTKTHKDLYTAKQTVKEVAADTGTYLYVDGKGEPAGEVYMNAFQQLYPVVYTLKFTRKIADDFDFKVGKIECLWYDDPAKVPMDQWHWRLMIRVPDAITKAEVEKMKKQIIADKGQDVSLVQHSKLAEGRCLQAMHVGPYENEGETYAKLHAHADQAGLTLNGPAHEVYLSDPRRTAPEKLKTIVRLPVKA